MGITAAEIKKVVLTEDDFRHEMIVGSILDPDNVVGPPPGNPKSIIWNPVHGETYIDPRTDKPRQFDFRCRITRKPDESEYIFLAVECKNLHPDLPLVVCCRPRTKRESYHVCIAEKNGRPESYKVSLRSSIYKPHEFVGKSLLRLKFKDKKLCADGDSEIYDKWSQALASTYELADRAAHKLLAPRSSAFVMPLVVVPDNSLWCVNYNKNGIIESDPQQTNRCEYYVAYKLEIGLPFVITHIRFVTLSGLRKTMSEFADPDSNVWHDIFSITSEVFNPSPLL